MGLPGLRRGRRALLTHPVREEREITVEAPAAPPGRAPWSRRLKAMVRGVDDALHCRLAPRILFEVHNDFGFVCQEPMAV